MKADIERKEKQQAAIIENQVGNKCPCRSVQQLYDKEFLMVPALEYLIHFCSTSVEYVDAERQT